MSRAVLFVDRDGTLIEEPHDNQVDSLSKVRFMPGVFAALTELRGRGFRLVMVTNQNGLGTPDFPFACFTESHEFMLNAFASQGIRFDEVFVCPHRPSDDCACRKPRAGLLQEFLREHSIDLAKSAVIGDRDTDLQLAANIGVRGLTVRRNGAPEHTWPNVVRALLARQALIVRHTRETRVQVGVNLDAQEPVSAKTGIGFFDHMLEALAKHGGFSLELSCLGDLEVDEHHTVEDCALVLGEALGQALGDKRGLGRFGFVLPMDEAQADVALDLSGRPFLLFSGRFSRDVVGSFPTELVPHFFRSLSDSLRATLHVSVKGENTHHMVEACFKGVGRALRQALRREGMELASTKGVL
jgi:imidazoleglycerol-phosphate dehydratase/histidinol-phosphatase